MKFYYMFFDSFQYRIIRKYFSDPLVWKTLRIFLPSSVLQLSSWSFHIESLKCTRHTTNAVLWTCTKTILRKGRLLATLSGKKSISIKPERNWAMLIVVVNVKHALEAILFNSYFAERYNNYFYRMFRERKLKLRAIKLIHTDVPVEWKPTDVQDQGRFRYILTSRLLWQNTILHVQNWQLL